MQVVENKHKPLRNDCKRLQKNNPSGVTSLNPLQTQFARGSWF